MVSGLPSPLARANQARALRPVNDDDHATDQNTRTDVDNDGRPTVRITSDPDAIRTLTEVLNDRGIPDTYVRDGELIVLEQVSGTAPAAGDDDAPLPLAAGQITPPRLAALLADTSTSSSTAPPAKTVTPKCR